MLAFLSTKLQFSRRFTASDQVFVNMRSEIVEGVIKQGSKISEPELAKRYGVSRATLREALNRLENCNLVERKGKSVDNKPHGKYCLSD